eukprot:1380160-Pyramimonas_sp.AAC.1
MNDRTRFAIHGLEENCIMPALSTVHNDKNESTRMLEFDSREIKSEHVRYCGLDILHDEDVAVSIAAEGAIEKIEAVSYPRDSLLTRKCNEGETAQLRSVEGALSWITRQCKPELLYRVSRLQTAVCHAKVLHFKEANGVLEETTQSADCGLVIKGGAVKWNQYKI